MVEFDDRVQGRLAASRPGALAAALLLALVSACTGGSAGTGGWVTDTSAAAEADADGSAGSDAGMSGDTSTGAVDAAIADGSDMGDGVSALPPELTWSIGGLPKASFEFQPDTTGGQLMQVAKVLLRNEGEGPLVIPSIAFKSHNAFLSIVYPDEKAAFPSTLKKGATLAINVRYKPDPNIDDTRPGHLEVRHNDSAVPDPLVLKFTIKSQGPKLLMETVSYTFINPNSPNGMEACFKFGNAGAGPLVFKSAQIVPASPYYTITQAPKSGTKIDALGSASNPKHNPKKLEICVRLKAGPKDKDHAAALVIKTTDGAGKAVLDAKVLLNAKWEASHGYKVTSDHPKGHLLYDFAGVTAGTKSRCLTIHNSGPAGFLISSAKVEAYDEKNASAAGAQYAVELYRLGIGGSKQKVKTPYSVNANKLLDVCVAYTVPASGAKPVAARMRIKYALANVANELQFPISPGACKVPEAVFAPSNQTLLLQAAVSKSAAGVVVIGNQSCAPLTVVKACVTQIAGPGIADPCSMANLVSGHFKIDTAVVNKVVAPWGLLPLSVSFAPPHAKYSNVNHLLNVVYCKGSFKAGKCDGGLVNRVINVRGHVKEAGSPTLPTLALSIEGGAKVVVGSPTKLVAKATAGTYPIAKYGAYGWLVSKRPVGSTLWLAPDLQITDGPVRTIVPDAPGDYEVIATVLSSDPQTPSKLAGSAQVKFSFKAVASP